MSPSRSVAKGSVAKRSVAKKSVTKKSVAKGSVAKRKLRSSSDAKQLRDRVVRANVIDSDSIPIADARVTIKVDGEVVGEAQTGISGSVTFQIAKTDRQIGLVATVGGCIEETVLSLDADKWTFHFPASEVHLSALEKCHLVILVHGINTRAQWMGVVKDVIEAERTFKSEMAGFGVYGLLRFLLPSDRLRTKAIDRVRRRINAAIQVHNPEKISVIAHSFGSYVVARIVADDVNRKWSRVIFCGSVLSDQFPFDNYLARFEHPILNEIATKDYLPALASAVAWGYGSIGSHGFQGAPIRERWHKGLYHSDFFTPEFCGKYWLPFLRNGEIVKADDPEPLPFIIRVLDRLPLRLLVVPILIALPVMLATSALLATVWMFDAQPKPWKQSSGWYNGGHTQSEICGIVAASAEQGRPGTKVEVYTMSEESKKNIFGHVEYKYHCQGLTYSGVTAFWKKFSIFLK